MLVVEGTGQESPLTYGKVSQYNRIDHNYFHDINNTGGNNWETMRIGRSWQGPTKGFNVIEHNLLKGDHRRSRDHLGEVLGEHHPPQHHARHGRRDHPPPRQRQPGLRQLHPGRRQQRLARHAGLRRRPPHLQQLRRRGRRRGIWLDDGSAAATDEPGAEHYRVYRTWVYNNTVIGQDIKVGGTKAFVPLDCRVANNIVIGGKINPDGTSIVSEGNIVGGQNPLTMQDGIYRLLPNDAGAPGHRQGGQRRLLPADRRHRRAGAVRARRGRRRAVRRACDHPRPVHRSRRRPRLPLTELPRHIVAPATVASARGARRPESHFSLESRSFRSGATP